MALDNHCGWVQLGYAVAEQAVQDVRALKSAGIIVEGAVTKQWPTAPQGRQRHRRLKRICGYSSPAEVTQLLTWFHNGSVDDLLHLLNAPVNVEAMQARLRI